MLTRLYADNFKTLLNFEMKLDAMNLLLGPNGSGKSNILEAIRLLRRFICDDVRVSKLFPDQDLCRWENRDVQTFEIGVREEAGVFAYKLEVAHDARHKKDCRVKTERLTLDNRLLYSVDDGKGTAYYDDGTSGITAFVGDRSWLGVLAPHESYPGIARFLRQMQAVWPIAIVPEKMRAVGRRGSTRPWQNMSNFASWYYHLVLHEPGCIAKLTEVLKDGVLDGLRSLRFKESRLCADFAAQADDKLSETTVEYRLGELSEGQRSLMALYTLVIWALVGGNTLCFDHPENALALPELQPWLMRLADATEEGRCQAIIATHHPEIINLLAVHSGYWLEREGGGPTRLKRIGEQDPSALPVSELIARGWLHD